MLANQANEVIAQLMAARQALDWYQEIHPESELLKIVNRNLTDAVTTIATAQQFAETSANMLHDAAKLITTAEKNLERIGLVHE